MRTPMTQPEPAIVRQVEGWVRGPDERPVAGALVSVIDYSSYHGVAFSTSDREGRFSIGLPATPVVVTATANGYVAGALVPAENGRLAFTLARPSGATRRFSGTVLDTQGRPLARVRVRLMSWSWPLGETFYVSSDEAGDFEFAVGSEGTYDLMVDDPRYVSDFATSLSQQPNRVRLTTYARAWIIAEAQRADVAALRALCRPVHGDGARQLVGSLGAARVVGLGEATHGTREFTEWRSRVIGELIRSGWLTTIALEASWEEAIRLDDYVRRGKGTGRDAVRALAYWPWRTEELLAFVESVRKLNDGLSADKKIEFLGIDYAPPGPTVDFMRRHFEGAGVARPDALSRLEPLRRTVSWFEPLKLSSEEREEALRALKELTHVAEREPLVSLPTIQGLGITQSIMDAHNPEGDFRDRVMAEAVLALLARSDKHRRVAIWAHDLHLAEGAADGRLPVGHYLKTRLAGKYRAIGSMFYSGSFRTYSGLQRKMVNHVVTPPPPFYFESAMYRASPSTPCVLDVREAVRHPEVRDWISVPKHVRFYGGLEISESYPWSPLIVPNLWSALIFVPDTSPTTPLE